MPGLLKRHKPSSVTHLLCSCVAIISLAPPLLAGSCGRQCGPHSLAYSTSSILPCFGKGLPDFSHCCEISHLAGLFTFRTRSPDISRIAPRSIVSVALSLFFKLRPYSLANRGTLWLARAAFALALKRSQ